MPGKKSTRLSELGAEQLKDILRVESTSDDKDVEWLKQVISALDERSEKHVSCDVDAAWTDFVQNYAASQPLYPDLPVSNRSNNHSDKRHAFGKLTKLVAAAVLLVLLSITASALGYDIWGTVARWTSEVFSFKENTDAGSLQYPDELAEIQAALKEDGIDEEILPTWLPDGYVQDDFISYDYVNDATLYTVYLSNQSGQSIVLEYVYHKGFSTQYQKDNETPEIYVVAGVDHYIMFNTGEYLISWVNGRIECGIFGLVSKEDVYRVIESIYHETA